MKIKSCEIKNFGKLCDKTVSLSDGITVIRGSNESGKSTFSAFIKYVLYGFSGKGGRDERNNEKLRYTPWNGLKCSGALVLEDTEHTLYRAERSSDGKNSKGKILDSMGAECFSGYDAGEIFFGTDASAFTKSCFVGQEDIQPDDMKELGSSLEKLLMRGDADEENFEKASKNLTAEKNKLYNKMRSTGRIFELEGKIYDLKAKRNAESEKNARLNASQFAASETEKNLEITNERLSKLYAESENIEAYRAAELLETIRNAKNTAENAGRSYENTVRLHTVNGFVPNGEYLTNLQTAHSEYLSVRPEYVSAEKALENVRLRYDSAKEKLFDGNGFDESAEKDDTEVQEFFENAEKLSAEAKKLKKLAILFTVLVLTLPIAVVLFVLYSKKNNKLKQLLRKYGFSDYAELEKYRADYDSLFPELASLRKEQQEAESLLSEKTEKMRRCAEKLSGLLSLYGFNTDFSSSDTELRKIDSEIIPKTRIAVSEVENSFAEYSKCKNAYDALISVSNISELELLASKKQEKAPERSKEVVDRAIKYDEGAKSMLSAKLNEYKRDIAALGASVTDPADIEDEIFRLENELSEAKLHNGAIELAIELMEKSAVEIRGNVFPKISERAGELFSAFTGGKYRSLFFDEDYAVKVLEENDTETRKSGWLSSGALDSAYIALRVALAEHLCKENPTLIFDDSFAKIDDSRLENILKVLEKLSEEYQIIILTCHTREENILHGKCKTVMFD